MTAYFPATRDWVDYIQAVAAIATAVAAAVGLLFVVKSLQQASEQRRVEAGPYVRVDIGPQSGVTDDFQAEQAHFHETTRAIDLTGARDGAVIMSAWFRNYQPHALGVAFSVSATFVVGAEKGTPEDKEVFQWEAHIPYIEHGKPVQIDLVRLNGEWSAEVYLAFLRYYDLYDNCHEHSFGEKGANAHHGRLYCSYANGRYEAVPEGRPRGEGVEFPNEEILQA